MKGETDGIMQESEDDNRRGDGAGSSENLDGDNPNYPEAPKH